MSHFGSNIGSKRPDGVSPGHFKSNTEIKGPDGVSQTNPETILGVRDQMESA